MRKSAWNTQKVTYYLKWYQKITTTEKVGGKKLLNFLDPPNNVEKEMLKCIN